MTAKYTPMFAPPLLATLITLGVTLATATESGAHAESVADAESGAHAESAAELLEKGIYTEQTVGDLAAAIEIYRRVVEKAEANRPHVAQAQFRLAMCYLKKGNNTQAKAALDRLIREFPEQERLVAQAHERLAAAQPALVQGPAPWEDGESLEYQISLPTGKVLGKLLLRAEATVVDGVEAWRLEQRKFIFSSSDNYGVSRVLVDRHTQRPIHSTFRHGVLGNADATYGPDGVEITGGVAATHLDSPQDIYDNEQSMHLARLLPLAPGYEVSIQFLPTWTGKILDIDLKVTGQEVCQVPAGEFECHAVQLGSGQTVWYSTGEERYPLKLVGSGVIVELADIGEARSAAPVPFGLADFGFSGTLPGGWMSHPFRSAERAHSAMVRFLDPEVASISAVEVDRCPRGKCPPLQQTAERELAGAKQRFEAYQLREGSWSERLVAGQPAISFVGDYQRNGKAWVQYRLYTFVNEVRFEFIFRTPKDSFSELRPTFDTVVKSLEAL